MSKMDHNLRPIDPAGNSDRRWRCIECGRQGRFAEFIGNVGNECIEPGFASYYDSRVIDAIDEEEVGDE